MLEKQQWAFLFIDLDKGRKIVVATETDALTVAKQSTRTWFCLTNNICSIVRNELFMGKNSVISISDTQVLYWKWQDCSTSSPTHRPNLLHLLLVFIGLHNYCHAVRNCCMFFKLSWLLASYQSVCWRLVYTAIINLYPMATLTIQLTSFAQLT